MPNDQPGRDAALARVLKQIDGHLQTGAYSLAVDALERAERDFPGDEQLAGRRTVLNIATKLGGEAQAETVVRNRPAAPPADADRTQVIPGRKPEVPSVWGDQHADPNEKTVVLTKADRAALLMPDHKPVPPAPPPLPPPRDPENEPTVVITRADRAHVLGDRPPVAAPPPILTGPEHEPTAVIGRVDRGKAGSPPSKDPVLHRTAPLAPPVKVAAKKKAAGGSLWPIWIAIAAAVIILGSVGIALYSGSDDSPTVAKTTETPKPPEPLPPPVTPPTETTPPPPPPVETTPPVVADPAPRTPGTTATPKPRPNDGRTPAPSTPQPARLTVTLDPGTQISLDNVPIGTVGADGSLPSPPITPGNHTLTFNRAGFQPVTIQRTFAAGATIALSKADVAMKATPGTLVLNAEADTQLTIRQGGKDVQPTARGSASFTLQPGTYEVASKGPAGVEQMESVTLAPGETKTLDVRVVAGMEGFLGWSFGDGWYSKRGGDFAMYQRANGEGRYTFTVRTTRSGNPFSSASSLKWVFGDVASKTYVLFELSRNEIKRSPYTGGKKGDEVKERHDIPNDTGSVNFAIQVSGARIMYQYQVADGPWKTFSQWDRDPPIANKHFGFYLPGSEQISISNFRFYPPSR